MKKSVPKQPFGAPSNPSVLQNAITLQHLAFESSFQPQLITDNVHGEILHANSAACNLFGYSRDELLTRKMASLFGLSEPHFKKSFLDNPSAGTFLAPLTAIRKNGDVLHCELSAAVFTTVDGEAKAILNVVDMSHTLQKQQQIDTSNRKAVADDIALAKAMQKLVDIKKEKQVVDDIVRALAKADARLAQNNEWKKYIGKTSYDVMWDWEIGSEDVYVSDSVLEVFGYKVENNTIRVTELESWVLAEERGNVGYSLSETLASRKDSWNASFMLRYNNGTFAETTARASIVRNGNGKAIRLIGALQDVSRLKQLEKKLKDQIVVQQELSEIFQVASRLSFDARWDWNLITNDFVLGEGFLDLFGYAAENVNAVTQSLSDYIHPEDLQNVEASLHNVISSTASEWEYAYRIIKSDGTFARVVNRASIIRNTQGKACRVIGVVQDVTKQKGLEERLEREIRTKTQQIADATQQAKEMERSELGKELHDNVNQLLGVSKLYLDLARQGGNDSTEFLNRSSQYTLTAIDEIRKLTKGLTTDIIQQVGLWQSIENIAAETMQVQPLKISCLPKGFVEANMDDKFKLNIFRMVQEQLNNIVKHANATKVTIELSQSDHLIVLSITDDGEGFDTSKKRDGIGIENIKNRAASYDGIAEVSSAQGSGCELIVTFPATAGQ